jgi:EAL domain-containing protein (putative c-di-GMP-specific phosphodiesterase class I)
MVKKIRLQPLLTAVTGSIYGYEVLFNRGNAIEYPSAESILRSVSTICKQNNDLILFINMSEKDAIDASFHKKFIAALHETGVDGSRIVLEVSENTNPDTLPQVKKILSLLRMHGVKIAIDDFGTKYATLSFIKDLPIDIIKIDKNFVQDAPYSKKSRTLLKFCVNVAHDIGCKVVAEGIESEEQFNCAKDSNVDFMQGFLFPAFSNSILFNNLREKKYRPFMNLDDFTFFSLKHKKLPNRYVRV